MPSNEQPKTLSDYTPSEWKRGKVIKSTNLNNIENYIYTLTDQVLNIDNRLVDFVGANSTTDGVKGVVPAPRAGDENKYLKGDGSWETPAAKHGTSTGAVAEGIDTEASGEGSHAEGQGTIANHSAQHVFGTYNIAESPTINANEKGTYIEIVGNGASESERANARTLDWEGNEILAGGITATSFTGSGAGLTNISGTEVGLATSSAAGAMSSADKVKLDELPTNTQLQTNYVSKSSVSDASGIPNADTTQYGLVKIGSNINVDNGVISVPLATSSISGIVSVGNGLSINNGVISNNLNIKNGAGNYSIIAGDSNNVASANYSYAIGRKTVAQKECQYVFGKYNKIDTSTNGTFVEIVGNGALGARSNARTLDWDGNEWVAGQMTATQFNGSGAGLTSIPPNIIIPLIIEIDPDDNNWTTQSSSQGGNISTHYLHDLTIPGITSTSIIFIIPNAIDNYMCTTCEASYVLQKDNQITFRCRTKPSRKITIGVIVYN